MQAICDVHDYYLRVGLDSPRLVTLDPTLHFEHQEACFSAPPRLVMTDIEPPLVYEKDAGCDGSVDLHIELWEEDGALLDDHDDLLLTVDRTLTASESDCYWPGDHRRGGFCWELEIINPDLIDSDGDGLADSWESFGIDRNCDGRLLAGEDLFLHRMGADPHHKDLFVELNWFTQVEKDPTTGELSPTPTNMYLPSRETLVELRQAFAAAPKDAGGTPNPDGTNGIRVHFDAGALWSMPLGRGGRDLGFENDPAIWGRDNRVAYVQSQSDPTRAGVFHEIYFGPMLEESGDLDQSQRGQSFGHGKIMLMRTDAIAIMHELGHSMNLKHGGETGPQDWPRVGRNCKPNHLSIMNYAYSSTGIPYANGAAPTSGATVIEYYLDFSPSKFPNDRVRVHSSVEAACPMPFVPDRDPDLPWGCNSRLGLLPDLNEAALDETMLLYPSTLDEQKLYNQLFTYADGDETIVTRFIDNGTPFDFDAAGPSVPPSRSVAVNIDLRPDIEMGDQGCTASVPGTDTPLNSTFDVLRNLDEWSNIRIAPITGVEASCWLPSPEEREALRRESLKADLALAGGFAPTPTYTGSSGSLFFELRTLGKSVVSGAKVEVTLPEGTSFSTLPPGCEPTGVRTLVCAGANPNNGRPLEPGHTRVFSIAVRVGPNPTGTPRFIALHASHEGPDPAPLNDTLSIPIVILPGFLGFEDEDRPWVFSWSQGRPVPLDTENTTGGDHSLALFCGTSQFESPTFDTAELEQVGTTLVVDAFVPEAHPDPGWTGDLQLSVDIPSAQVWNQWVGAVSLSGLAKGEWSEIHFELPSALVDVLLGDFPDARLRLAANVAGCDAPLLLDSFRFEGDLEERTRFHAGAAGAPRSTRAACSPSMSSAIGARTRPAWS